MNSQDLKDRTKQFALRCIKMSHALPNTLLGNHIRHQIIKSATSVAANYRAACMAQTKAAFISKISIVAEEIDEALFWMEIIVDEKLIPSRKMQSLMKEANDLTAIFICARRTAQRNRTD